MENITELFEIYGRAIEFYDSRKDPVSKYFQDKIQFLLSRKEVLHSLVN